jgi:tetratricopeptide (TPR) repeat protein
MALIGILSWFTLSNWWQNRLPSELVSAQSALQAHNVEKARMQFDRVLTAQPANPALYAQILALCAQASQWELAIGYGERGVQACRNASKDDLAALYRQLALGYTETESPGRQKQALAAAERALELAPEDSDSLNLLGYLLADNNRDLDRAQRLITQAYQAMQSQPQTPMTQVKLAEIADSYGWVLYRKGSYGAAADAIRQAIDELPDNDSLPDGAQLQGSDLKILYYHLGAAYRKAGQTAAARNALQIALYYDPNYGQARAEWELLPPASDSGPESGSGSVSSAQDSGGPALPAGAALGARPTR